MYYIKFKCILTLSFVATHCTQLASDLSFTMQHNSKNTNLPCHRWAVQVVKTQERLRLPIVDKLQSHDNNSKMIPASTSTWWSTIRVQAPLTKWASDLLPDYSTHKNLKKSSTSTKTKSTISPSSMYQRVNSQFVRRCSFLSYVYSRWCSWKQLTESKLINSLPLHHRFCVRLSFILDACGCIALAPWTSYLHAT